MNAIPNDTDKALGIFAMNEIPYVLDRNDKTPSLPEMSQKSDRNPVQKTKNGFTMMIEQGVSTTPDMPTTFLPIFKRLWKWMRRLKR